MALRHVILTVLARGKMTGYEITKNFETVYSHFWRASHQQVYRELGRLSTAGFVHAKVIVQRGKPDKKIYRITKQGLSELKQWLLAPTDIPRSQYDLLVKLLGCHAIGSRAFLPELKRIRNIAEEWVRSLRSTQRDCLLQGKTSWSEHQYLLYLALRRGLLLGEAQIRWLSEVDDYLSSGKIPK